MDLKLPGEEKKKKEIPFSRIAIWVIVGGFAVYLIISGIYEGVTKGSQ